MSPVMRTVETMLCPSPSKKNRDFSLEMLEDLDDHSACIPNLSTLVITVPESLLITVDGR